MIDNTTPAVLSAMHALFAALGEPTSYPVTEYGDTYECDSSFNMIGVHPVFPLTETHDTNMASYTRQHATRGGRVTVPCYTESGDVAVLETTFHKGDTAIHWVVFPREPRQVSEALFALLSRSEVRS